MAFILDNLDGITRKLMINEINYDINDNKLYRSKRFNVNGHSLYPQILIHEAGNGTEETLARELKSKNCFSATELRRGKAVKVPENAHETFADGEFNRYYLRGLCLRAITEGKQIEIYRAKNSVNPRPESQRLIGKILEPAKLLEDLRNNIGVDTVLGLPAGPNSGLSGKLK